MLSSDFPAETDADFETTRRFLEKVHFYEMHVFPYSRRAGTRADRMPDQVPEPVKKERSAVLLKLEKKMSGEYRSPSREQNRRSFWRNR